MKSKIILTQKDIVRFWSKVDRRSDYDCWLWTGYIRPNGYGYFRLISGNTYAHRIAYIITHGDIPNKGVIMHSCDNPRCVNPKHLTAGTQYENIHDMISKGRGPVGDNHYMRRNPSNAIRVKGSNNPMSKLTESDVVSIRARVSNGEKQAAIAREYRVTKDLIYQIIHRYIWKHI